MKLCIAAVTAVALVVPMTGVAHAHTVVKGDWNDTASPLDISVAGFLHTRRLYAGGVQMHDVFRNGMLGPKGDAYMDLDSVGTRAADYYVRISTKFGELTARVYRYSGNTSYFVGRGRAWRANRKLVMFSFRRGLIRRSGGYIRFYGSTRYQRSVDEYGRVYNWWDRSPWRTHLF